MSFDDDIIQYESNLEALLKQYNFNYTDFKRDLCNELLKENILTRKENTSMIFRIEMKHVGQLSPKREIVKQWVKLGEVRDIIRVIQKCKPLAKLGSQNPYLVDVSRL